MGAHDTLDQLRAAQDYAEELEARIAVLTEQNNLLTRTFGYRSIDTRIELDEEGTKDETLDEIVTAGIIHFEAMDQSQWWMRIDSTDGHSYTINCGAVNPNAKGYAHLEIDD